MNKAIADLALGARGRKDRCWREPISGYFKASARSLSVTFPD